MDFTLSKEHEMARTLFRDFAQNEVKPFAQEVDETNSFQQKQLKKGRNSDLWGFLFQKNTADRAVTL